VFLLLSLTFPLHDNAFRIGFAEFFVMRPLQLKPLT